MFRTVGQISLNLSSFDGAAHNFRALMTRITRGSSAERRVFDVDYESTLVYVSSPDLDLLNGPVPDRVTFDDQSGDIATSSVARVDFCKVLQWLHEIHGVSRIIELEVRDSLLYPHSEEAIKQNVSIFKVKKLNWKRLDLSIPTVQVAAPKVRELTLYSSGNKAAFYHWFSSDGLPKLKAVRL